VRCPECGGDRFNSQTLAVRYRGASVADVLAMTIDEAFAFFVNLPRLARPLKVFQELGLGYLHLGQPATALSGGEAQRVKLATELWKTEIAMPTLFVLDEPTTGLHAADVAQLLGALRGLIQSGNSVVVIEHNLDLIAAADWVIDLGPGAGTQGGRVVAEGPPGTLMECHDSLTGHALRAAFNSR
jgi:excinuclease ABC subunit A